MTRISTCDGLHRDLWTGVNKRVTWPVFALIVTLLVVVGGSVVGYAVARSNGKADAKVVRAAEMRMSDTSERVRALETQWVSMAKDMSEARKDIRKILDRLK